MTDDEISKKSGELGRDFLNGWILVRSECPERAMVLLVGTLASAWGLMMPQERSHVLRTFMQMVIDVGSTQFEDGSDFLSFLKEKKEEE